VAITVTRALPLTSPVYDDGAAEGDVRRGWTTRFRKLQPNQRFLDAKMAEAGFSNLIHRGAKVVWSDIMPSTTWYFLNSNHVKLAVLDGNWMKFRGFVEPYDRDAKYGLITNYGTFITDERRKLAKRLWN